MDTRCHLSRSACVWDEYADVGRDVSVEDERTGRRMTTSGNATLSVCVEQVLLVKQVQTRLAAQVAYYDHLSQTKVTKLPLKQ